MANSIFEMASTMKLTLLIVVLCFLISLKNRNVDTKNGSSCPPSSTSFSSSWDLNPSILLSLEDTEQGEEEEEEEEEKGRSEPELDYDFYRNSCPQAERIIREVVREMYQVRSSVAAAFLRLVFHDCFIQGCDASILLDGADGLKSEKDSPPNQNLKGFDLIDVIKSQLEQVCAGVVSCADIVVLAARESVVQAGGPFYPLLTGRRDSNQSFPDVATAELPSPQAHLSETLSLFSSKGFDERETVCLLGGHSIGTIHCKFFLNRLQNFDGSNKPDPSIDPKFLIEMRSICNSSNSSETTAVPHLFRPSASLSSAPTLNSTELSFSRNGHSPPSSNKPGISARSHSYHGKLSSSTKTSISFEGSLLSLVEQAGINMAYEGPGVEFGTLYFRSLLQNRGILVVDQQLMTGEETENWVRTYASDVSLFRRDFARAMLRLSNLHVLTGSEGQVRFNCSKAA